MSCRQKTYSFPSILKHYHYRRNTLKFYFPTSEIRIENSLAQMTFWKLLLRSLEFLLSISQTSAARMTEIGGQDILSGETFKDRVLANSS